MTPDDTLTKEEVLEAITILSDEQQEQVLKQIAKDGGVTPEYGLKIAALLDGVIQDEGGLPALHEEGAELTSSLNALHRQNVPVAFTPEEESQQLEDELTDQRQTYEQWLQDVHGAEKASAQRKEGAKKEHESAEIAELRRLMKGGQPSQN